MRKSVRWALASTVVAGVTVGTAVFSPGLPSASAADQTVYGYGSSAAASESDAYNKAYAACGDNPVQVTSLESFDGETSTDWNTKLTFYCYIV